MSLLRVTSWSSGKLHSPNGNSTARLTLDAHSRRTVDGQSRYFIREINNVYAVGQTLPAVSQTKQHLMDMPTSQAATRRGTRWIRIIIKKLLAKHGGIVKQSHLRPFWPEWSDRDWTLFLKVGEAGVCTLMEADQDWTFLDFHVFRKQKARKVLEAYDR
jgi:hypothetical protein